MKKLTFFAFVLTLLAVAILYLWPQLKMLKVRSTFPVAEKTVQAPSAATSPIAPNALVGTETRAEKAPVRSSLPLTLVGTIVHNDRSKSICTLRLANLDRKLNYFTEQSIEQLAKVVEIRREIAILRNTATGDLEYLQIGAFDLSLAASSQALDDQQFSVKELQVERLFVDEALANLPKVINEAGTRPVVSSDGAIGGFQMTFVKPGSVFEKLGLKEGDILRSVNNTALTSAATAIELFNQLKESSMIGLKIERAGRSIDVTYLIR